MLSLAFAETPWSTASHCACGIGHESETASQASSQDVDLELQPVPEEPEDLQSQGPFWRSETAQLAWLTENVPRGARLPLPSPNTFKPSLPELPEVCNVLSQAK